MSIIDEKDQDVLDFEEAMKLMRNNDLEKAIELFHIAATTGVDRPMEHYALAVALYRNKQWAEAKKEIETFFAMSPEDNQYLRQAHQILPRIEEHLQEAESENQKKHQVNPLSECAAYEQAIQAYMRNDYDEALEGFQEALGDLPDNPHIHNNLGLTFLAQQRHQDAVDQFEQAIKIDPDFLEAKNNLGLAWLDFGTARAQQTWESILESDGEFFDTLLNLGSLYYKRGNRPRARQLWQRAQRLRPNDAQLRRNLKIV